MVGLGMKERAIKFNYTSEELNSQLGRAIFCGLSLRVYRVAHKNKTYEFKCTRVPRTNVWTVSKKKIR